MKKTKFLFLLTAILALVVFAAACGGSEESGSDTDTPGDTGNESGNETENEGAEGSGETINITFSHNLKEDSANGRGVTLFKEIVEEKTNGQMQVDIYPDQQLGSMREQAEQTQFGSIEITMQGLSVLTPFIPSMGVFDLPFLFEDEDILWESLTGEPGQLLLDSMEGSGFKGLTFANQGFRQMTTPDFPVTHPDDLRNVSFRVMPSDLLVATYEEWGARPTSIDFAEVYNALQQGVVDAQDNPLESIYQMKFYEVQDYLTMTNHTFLGYAYVANDNWFNSLSEEHQNILIEAAQEAAEYSHRLILEENEEILGLIEESGTNIAYLSEEGRQAFIEASEPIYEQLMAEDPVVAEAVRLIREITENR